MIFAALLVPLALATGIAVDYTRAAYRRDAVQQAGDAVVLAVARDYDEKQAPASRNSEIDQFIAAMPGGQDIHRDGDLRFDDTSGEVCVDVTSAVPMTFAGVIGVDIVPVRSTSCANVSTSPEFEIALVLDVSSSMIEEGRFAPMQTAVRGFLDSFEADPALRDRAWISIVPFSSRVSIGLQHTNWLKPYGGEPAVPARWTDPRSVYGSAYTELTWLDGVTTGYSNSTNTYWLGCIEPRSDAAAELTGSVSAAALGDAPPAADPFVAMDANDRSGKSFCPTPIVPLTKDFTRLKTATDRLTSQGTTRLDAGAVAGWYALSPRWQGIWGTPDLPTDDPGTIKAMVFMTDGQMNTQYGQSPKHFDWRCTTDNSKGCNDDAVDDFLAVCTAMRAAGITIYAVSYGEEADEDNLRDCAGEPARFFTADASTSGADSIVTVYQTIAGSLKETMPRLSR